MMNEKLSILYVDDEHSNLNIFKNTFRREYNVHTAISANEGLEILNKNKIDLILTDQRMPEMTGVEFLKHTIKDFPHLNRILVTGYTDFNALTDAINHARIFQFIQKPWNEDHLREVIENGLELYKLKKEKESLTSELKTKNKELEKANKELLEYDKLKSDFLAIISHEIRTPLNGLVGPISLLKEELNQANVKQLLNVLDTSVKRLEQFAISTLHLTNFKAKNQRIVLDNFNVLPIINNAIGLQNEFIKQKNIHVIKNFNSDIELLADKDLFYICIKEVFDNAVKYCFPDTDIEIKILNTDAEFKLSVTNKGDGFSEKVMKHLFVPFVTGDKIFASPKVGLDLALVKLIMEAHNGEILIDNKPGIEATVHLRFLKNSIKK